MKNKGAYSFFRVDWKLQHFIEYLISLLLRRYKTLIKDGHHFIIFHGALHHLQTMKTNTIIQTTTPHHWIPAFAGMTGLFST